MYQYLNFTPSTQSLSINTFRKPNTFSADSIIVFARDVQNNYPVSISLDDPIPMIDALCDGSLLEGLSQSTVERIHNSIEESIAEFQSN